MKNPSWLLRAGALFALALSVASAATINVSSISGLQSAINGANPGDVIVMANGSYSISSTLNIARAGNSTNWITIKAATVGGVTLSGSAGVSFASPAAFVSWEGFVHTHSGSINIPSSVNHIRVTRCTVQLSIAAGADVSYLNISGDDVEISYNEMKNKSTLGEMLDIAGSGSQVARRLWVHHNYFHDFTSPGGNGAETIRWGLSGLSLSTGSGICEYNLFVRCNGENEMISNKSSGNIYRYNTVIDSREISQRHGNFCQYYGNYMLNSEGIRVYGDNHLIHSNYLEGNTVGINMGNGDGEVENGAALTSHDKPDDCVVVFNTLVNNTTGYQMGGRTGGLGADSITFANNIIQGGTTAVSISSTAPYSNPTWAGNIIWNATSIGNIPASGYSNVNPLLAADVSGILHLQSGSPAIDTATGTYSGVTFDQDGQPRPSTGKDKGADEVSSATVTAWLLTTDDVGPSAGLGGGGGGTTITSADGFVNQAITNQTGTFTAEFDASSSVSPANAVVGFSSGTATAYTGIAAMVRFNQTGQIDARNGGGFTTSTINFSANTTYHFRMVMNVSAHTYSAYVTAPGGSEQTIGANLAFRTEQASVTNLNNATFNVNATPGGSLTVWPITISSSGGTPAKLTVPAANVTASADDGNVPANTVDGSLSTRWSASGDGQWIRFDLGSTKTVSSVKIAFYNGDVRTSSFEIQTSTDGVNFTTQGGVRTSSGTSLSLETFDLNPDVSARYVRYLGHGNSSNLWNSLTEVEVWGF
jgi:hypothetical protein